MDFRPSTWIRQTARCMLFIYLLKLKYRQTWPKSKLSGDLYSVVICGGDTLRFLGAIEIHCNRAVYVSLNTNANPKPDPNPKLSPSPNPNPK